MQPYKKPKKFDYNLIAIGAGSAGLVTTYIGSAIKARIRHPGSQRAMPSSPRRASEPIHRGKRDATRR